MPEDTSQPADRVKFETFIGGRGACDLATAQAATLVILRITANSPF